MLIICIKSYYQNKREISVNLADKMKEYPRRAIECAERALFNLSFKYPHYGDIICPMHQDRRYLFEHERNNNGSFGVLELLCDLGYVKDVDGKQTYVIVHPLFEISRSKFVVVDITYPNFGAYYEAGYAQALGKEVIVCCPASRFGSDDKNQRPHFDIAQKSMIVWNNEAELINRLKRRIEATVK